MALMLAGAVIAQVFNTLGAITGNIFTFIVISFLGNALNFGLNLLGVKDNGKLSLMITPGTRFDAEETLLVLGTVKDIQKTFHI